MMPGKIATALSKNESFLKLFNMGTYVHDSRGNAVASFPPEIREKRPVFTRAMFLQLKESARPVFSNVFKDKATGELLIMMAVPLLNDDRSFAGTISGTASIKDSLLRAECAELLEFKAGRSGYAYLVDGNGVVIYHQYGDQIGKKLRDNVPVQEAIQGKIGAVLHKDQAGKTAIVAFAPVPGTDWALITQEEWSVVVLPTRHYRLILVGILLGGILVSIVLIFLAVNRTLRPIRDLTEGAQRIAEGDFDYRISTLSGDEIQTLSEQFNTMAQTLKQSYADLEHRVQERTADLEVAKQKAEEADRLKSSFLATMSHELRTPLHSILGFAVTLQREMDGPLNPEQKKQLGIIHDCAKHLLALITDILDLSKIEAGRMELGNEEFHAGFQINQAILTVAPLTEQKGLELSADIAPEVGNMFGDKQRIRQILLNLLDNAIKFTDSGSVKVSARLLDEQLEVRVKDTGIGIRPEDTQKLFETFRQIDSKRTRKHEGTGLGLAICKKLITMMGGEIRAESEYGVGSTFTFSLPTARLTDAFHAEAVNSPRKNA